VWALPDPHALCHLILRKPKSVRTKGEDPRLGARERIGDGAELAQNPCPQGLSSARLLLATGHDLGRRGWTLNRLWTNSKHP
jgi:hypothetical protein